MTDDVRARLIYDVSSAQTSVRSLGSDLDRLERPISLTIAVNDAQLTDAVANVLLLKEEVANLAGLIALDDAQVVAAEEQVGTIDTELQDLTGTVEIDDTQLAAADEEIAALDEEISGLSDVSLLDGAFDDLISGAGTADDYLAALDASLGLTIDDAETAATAADSLGTALTDAAQADFSNSSAQIHDIGSEAEQAASEVGSLGGALGTTGEAAGELVGGIGQLGTAGGIAGGELESVGGIATTLGESFSGAVEKTESLATAMGADLGPEATALIGTLAGLGVAAGVFGTVVDKIVSQAIDLQSAQERLDIATHGEAESFQDLSTAGLGVLDTQEKLATALGATAAATDQANAKQALLIEQNTKLTDEQKKQFEVNLSLISANATTIGLQQDYAAALDGSIKGLANYQRAGLAYGVALSKQDIEQEQATLGIDGTFSSLDRTTKAYIVSEAAVAKYGDSMRSNVAEANKISALSFASVEAEFKNFLGELGKPIIAPALDLIKAAEPFGRDFAEVFGSLAQVALPPLTAVLHTLEPLVKIITDDLSRALITLGPALQETGDIIATTLSDPDTVRATEDFAHAISQTVIAVAPLLPLVAELSPLFVSIGPTLELVATQVQIFNDSIAPTLALLNALGVIQPIAPKEVFLPPKPEDINATKDAAEANKVLADKAQEAELKTAAEAEAADQLASSMRGAKVSVDDLSKALDEAFKQPTEFDVAEAQAKFVKDAADARAKVLKEGGLSLIDPKKAEESFATLDKLTADFKGLTDAQIKVGQFDPKAFDIGKQQLLDLAGQLGLTGAQLDLYKQRLDKLGTGQQIEVRASFTLAEAEIDKLSKTEDIVAFLKQNPNIKSAIEINGTAGLKNAEQVQTALDVIDGRKANAEVGIDDQTQETADEIDRRLEDLDNSLATPEVRVNDIATAALEAISSQVSAVDEQSADPTVGVNDQATPKLTGIAAILAGIAADHTSAVVSVIDQASGPLGYIQQALDRIRAIASVQIAVQSVLSSIPHAERGMVVDHESLIVAGEGGKRELILPLEQPWERQLDLLDQTGVLARLEAQFTAEEQARAAAINRAVAFVGPERAPAGPTTADLEAIATRMEAAARLIASESRPIHAPITVPALRDEHETARILRAKLVRL